MSRAVRGRRGCISAVRVRILAVFSKERAEAPGRFRIRSPGEHRYLGCSGPRPVFCHRRIISAIRMAMHTVPQAMHFRSVIFSSSLVLVIHIVFSAFPQPARLLSRSRRL